MGDRTPVIMVAEAKADLRWLYHRWLSEEGYHVRLVEDGAWALSLIPPDPPDLLLVDLHLPAVDGFEVCRIIRANPDLSSMPILATTCQTDPVIVNQALLLGVQAVLLKPLSRTELAGFIERIVGPPYRFVAND